MNLVNPHLTHEQISDLLVDGVSTGEASAAAHLEACSACSGELTTLRRTLTGFREATTLYSANQPRRAIVPARRSFGNVSLWVATAAAALAIGIAVPMNLHRAKPVAVPVNVVVEPTVQTASVQQPMPTDEELVAGIEQDLSASISSSMQPLEDPIPSTKASTQASK